MTIATALQQTRQQLTGDEVELEAQLLLCHVLQCKSVYLLTWPEQLLTAAQKEALSQLTSARRAGQPLAYLLGSRGFWDIELQVNPHTLIPRPDTELLVELALNVIRPGMQVIDLGTGSGAIALALANANTGATITATDTSPQALATARKNAGQLNLKVDFVQNNWLVGFPPAAFDVVVSNPPYIAAGDPHLTTGDVRFEPQTALVSGEDGLDDIRQIAEQSRQQLKPQGWLLLEHGHDQSESVQALLTSLGYAAVQAHRDLAGHWRAVAAQWPG